MQIFREIARRTGRQLNKVSKMISGTDVKPRESSLFTDTSESDRSSSGSVKTDIERDSVASLRSSNDVDSSEALEEELKERQALAEETPDILEIREKKELQRQQNEGRHPLTVAPDEVREMQMHLKSIDALKKASTGVGIKSTSTSAAIQGKPVTNLTRLDNTNTNKKPTPGEP